MRVGLIGAGNMARALARGWGDPVLCSDSGSGRAQALVDELGGETGTNGAVAQRADVVVLCHKPYQLRAVADEVAPQARVVVSVLAGTSVAMLREAYPDAQVFRLIPNTAVEVRRGTTIYGPSPGADPGAERQVIELFERVGSVVTVAESILGAATAITGVGPAYQALLAEAQVEAALRYGLPAAVASRLVVETMAGAAALIEHRGYDTLAIRREVTSPGGTTSQGLHALERAGVRTAFQDAMDAVAGGGRA